MKPVLSLFFFLLTVHTGFTQKKPLGEFDHIDTKTLQLPDSLTQSTEQIAGFITSRFASEKDRARAAFIWVASNIQYDIDNMFALNFYENKADKISKPLRTRKGICENYAALFTDICAKAGIKSFVVEGYTKQNGFTDYIPHAWSAARVDSTWFLFDPTWGSGFVNAGKFYRKINNDYFRATPATLIKSHMPFDYLWQLLPYPITNQEFYEGKTLPNKTKPFYSFKDSIAAFEGQSNTERLVASADRIEKNGMRNSMIFDRLHHVRAEIENEKQTKSVGLYNAAVIDYNEGINLYNDFITYRNKQFLPKKTDPEIQNMLDACANKFNEAKIKLGEIAEPDATGVNLIGQLTKSINEASERLKEQQDFLKEYFPKGKLGRKAMFYERKITFFGKSIN